jgi:hypothetical protein
VRRRQSTPEERRALLTALVVLNIGFALSILLPVRFWVGLAILASFALLASVVFVRLNRRARR